MTDTKMECPCCEKEAADVERRRLCTRYEEDESNYITTCLKCFEEQDEQYQEMMAEYLAGLFR